MKVLPSSAWSKADIGRFLDQAITPMRISCCDNDGFPIICSMWFVHKDGTLWAASHRNSYIVKVLKKSPKIGFEIATNEYPYHGVRGKATVTLLNDSVENVLETVIDRYLQGSNRSLSNWLLSRKNDEYALKISPQSITSWDFSNRMEGRK
ncbi:MAG: pyridoxamine 5'-phosphate oxidase family protein [Spongiibacter sp.]|nr:pyridoxamine 5'-phosphate oxidase family protein [Spongiibacter sp.]